MVKKLICGIMLSTVLLSCLSGCGDGIGKEGMSLEEYQQINLMHTLEDIEEIVGGKGDRVDSYTNEAGGLYIVYEFRGEKNGKALITVFGDRKWFEKKEEFDLE